MNPITFLHVAYAVTWLIHLGYIVTLISRFRALAKDVEDLKRK